MVIKIKLKNADKHVLLDHEVFETLSNTELFREYRVFENLRQHSSGVPVFQKYIETVNGKLKVESIYLALHIAKLYIPKPEIKKRLFLNFINGDKLDLRLKNLHWEEMSKLSRSRTTSHNKTGFRGVRRTPQNKYVAMISDGKHQIYLGTFAAPEEAALAYNNKSVELFGQTANLNKIDERGIPIAFEVSEEIKTRIRKRSSKKVVTKPMEVEKISLSPAHFNLPKKRGRKPKQITGDASVKPTTGTMHSSGNSSEEISL